MINRNFSPQYDNSVCYITDGLQHKQAISVLKVKIQAGLLDQAVIIGYRDCVAGVYDKFWRYYTKQERFYLQGVQAAINNGGCIERYLEQPQAFTSQKGMLLVSLTPPEDED